MMRKINSVLLLAILILTLCSVPVAAADTEIGYPARTFLYVLDCSGSMGEYKDAIDAARKMLSELLRQENTIEILFNAKILEPSENLTFGGQTSVLVGLQEADRRLEELLAENPERKITVLLFSDLHNSVRASDGETNLTEEYYNEVEKPEFIALQRKWNGYLRDGKLSFYSLPLLSKLKNNLDYEKYEKFTFPFDPNYPQGSISLSEDQEYSRQDVLKASVEAYAQMLTGSDFAEWVECPTGLVDKEVMVQLDQSYRSFLLVDKLPEQIAGPDGEVKFNQWFSEGAGLLLLDHVAGGSYTLHGLSEENQVSVYRIPQPAVMVIASPDNPMCLTDDATVSVSVKAGQEYLDYSNANIFCSIQLTSPSGGISELSVTYDNERYRYDAGFTPKEKGTYEIEVLLLNGTESQTVSRQIAVQPYSIRLTGQTLRDYKQAAGTLQTLSEGDDFTLCLSDYYVTPYRRLEFVVKAPEEPEIADWEPISDQTGEITVRAKKEGTATIEYAVRYYAEGAELPDNETIHTLTVSVSPSKPKPARIILLIAAPAFIVVAVVIGFVLLACGSRKKKQRGE